MNETVRKMIDDAKEAALKADRHSFEKLESDGTTTIVNRVPKRVVVDKAETDPSGFNGLTYGQIWEWEKKHNESCKQYHKQPCNCSAWD